MPLRFWFTHRNYTNNLLRLLKSDYKIYKPHYANVGFEMTIPFNYHLSNERFTYIRGRKFGPSGPVAVMSRLTVHLSWSTVAGELFTVQNLVFIETTVTVDSVNFSLNNGTRLQMEPLMASLHSYPYSI